ncbi:flagellar basal-body rod modification protein FlgD [Litorivivens lipolytica]|uniref:Basal-body rod modification protein FlgD n=1 Tax=Litorivivens lipolytica TaxID=1524264 RepID=A0A7W4Z4C4_9GAMM|nr:flagellar hook assembly protein FlgD [Litorivivens lipolytica]MBB3046384.1 flagellar basal-body rod modification protein FlgD [Litorivivens lipolytica]
MELRTISDIQALQGKNGNLGKENLGQNDFMKLMLAQMQNQDPFSPMDNAEFLGQMAQFSTVSGISEINTSMASLADSLKSSQMLNAASLVDKHALVASPTAAFDGATPVTGRVELPSSTSGVQVEVVGSNGEVVRRMSLGPQAAGAVDYAWDGRNSSGNAVPAGEYQLKVSYFSGNQQEALENHIHAQIMSVSLPSQGGSANVELKGLGQYQLSDVKSIS